MATADESSPTELGASYRQEKIRSRLGAARACIVSETCSATRGSASSSGSGSRPWLMGPMIRERPFRRSAVGQRRGAVRGVAVALFVWRDSARQHRVARSSFRSHAKQKRGSGNRGLFPTYAGNQEPHGEDQESELRDDPDRGLKPAFKARVGNRDAACHVGETTDHSCPTEPTSDYAGPGDRDAEKRHCQAE